MLVGTGKGDGGHFQEKTPVPFVHPDDDPEENPQASKLKEVTHIYDAYNRWIGRKVDDDGDGTVDTETFFIYDGDQIVLQFDGSEVTALSHRYVWGPMVDQILADETMADLGQEGDVLWPLTDNLGTVRDLAEYDSATDTTSIVDHYVYDAFGNETDHTGSNDFLFKYTGRAFDDETGLQNNLNRWFDPTVGRWLSEDPIGFTAGDANVYRYVGNFATGTTDPSGLVEADDVMTDYLKELQQRKRRGEKLFIINPIDKHFFLWVTVRTMCYDSWVMSGRGVTEGYAEARKEFDKVAEKTDNTFVKGVAKTGKAMTYPMQATSTGALAYSGAQLGGRGAWTLFKCLSGRPKNEFEYDSESVLQDPYDMTGPKLRDLARTNPKEFDAYFGKGSEKIFLDEYKKWIQGSSGN